MKVNDLITLAMKQAGILGVGQTLAAEDANDALSLLNMMLGQWQTKRWMVYGTVDWYIQSTGAQSYGWDNSAQRIDKIEAAFFRLIQANGPYELDYPLEIVQSRADYNRIALKTLTTFPQYVYYDGLYPTGTFYFWPVPPADLYQMHISVKAQLGSFTGLSETIDLPPEYQQALLYGLAPKLRSMYQLPPDPEINAMAIASIETLRVANAQVPRLEMPDSLMSGAHYNIYSDQVN